MSAPIGIGELTTARVIHDILEARLTVGFDDKRSGQGTHAYLDEQVAGLTVGDTTTAMLTYMARDLDTGTVMAELRVRSALIWRTETGYRVGLSDDGLGGPELNHAYTAVADGHMDSLTVDEAMHVVTSWLALGLTPISGRLGVLLHLRERVAA